jgi:hypothetical protein
MSGEDTYQELHIRLEGTYMGNHELLISMDYGGDHIELIRMVISAMDNDPKFKAIVQTAVQGYDNGIGTKKPE